MSGYARFQVGDVNGRILAELTPYVESVSTIINGVGRCIFALAKNDEKATAAYLNFGNRVLIEFENGLPNWGGIIDPPRDWANRTVTCTAYSAEHILDWRITGKQRRFSGASKGAIYRAVTEEALPIPAFGLGSVWTGGITHSPNYHIDSLLSVVRDSLCNRLGQAEFAVSAAEANGRIQFSAELYEERGLDTDLLLVEGLNVAQVRLSENGPIVNDWTIAGSDIADGEGDGWGDGRLLASAFDQASISAYGRRQGSEIYEDITVQSTLDSKVANLLKKQKQPVNLYDLIVVDEEPARFRAYGLGDVLTLQAPSVGFEGTNKRVRVVGRDYFPANGTINLVVQEVVA